MAKKRTALRAKPARRAAHGKPARTPTEHSRIIEHDDSAGVDSLVARLEHPLKAVVSSARSILLGARKGVTEGIKWNSPSFWLKGWFATVNVHPKRGVLVVFHQGAKGVADSSIRAAIPDPDSLLTWHSPDRASIAFASAQDFASRARAFERIARAWAAEHARTATSQSK